MDVKDSCVFYADWLEAAHTIENTALRCCFFEAVLQYALTGMEMETPPELKLAMTIVKNCIDRDRDKYQKKIEKRRAAGRLGGYQKAANLANVANDSKNSKCQQEIANVANVADNVNDNNNVNGNVNVNVKDNDFKNTPIPPRAEGVEYLKDLFNRIVLCSIKIPAMVQMAHYETQYLWRAIDATDYVTELQKAIKDEENADIAAHKIADVNNRYRPRSPFQMFKLAYAMTKLKTETQRQAVLDELTRSINEPDICRILTEKVEYLIQGNKVTALKGFMHSRRD